MNLYALEVMPDETIHREYLISKKYYTEEEFDELTEKIEKQILHELNNESDSVKHIVENKEYKNTFIDKDGMTSITKEKTTEGIMSELIERLIREYNFKRLKTPVSVKRMESRYSWDTKIEKVKAEINNDSWDEDDFDL